MTVLIAEDDADLREALVDLFRARGWTVREVRDGAEAVAVFDSGGGVDVILTDFCMPQMSGLDVARHVAGRVPVILYAADPPLLSFEDRAFFSRVVRKGWGVERLIEVIEDVVRARREVPFGETCADAVVADAVAVLDAGAVAGALVSGAQSKKVVG